MTFLTFAFLTVVTTACVRADERNPITVDGCGGIQGTSGQPCSRTACANRSASCPLIPRVLCASDECGCHEAFYARVNQSGLEARIDVTGLCRTTVQIKEASDFMEGLLAGKVERHDAVASDPDVLFRVFSGLNTLSVSQLKSWIFGLDLAAPRDRGLAMETRRKFLKAELAGLEDRMRSREFDGTHNVVTRVTNVTDDTTEAQKELKRRKDIIRQWTKQQERVKILDESTSMYTLTSSTRMASRKYSVDNQGRIIGSRLPVYGNMLYGFMSRVSLLSMDDIAMFKDPGNGYKILEMYNQLKYILLDEIIAGRQLRSSDLRPALSPLSTMNSRIRFNYYSFAPLVTKAGVDVHAMLRLMSLAAQTGALGMDLYSNLVGQSPTLAGFVQDWNIADDLTELLF